MGGSMRDKGTKQTQTTENFNPPSWALPLYQKYAQDAMRFYNSGKGAGTYQGPRVADLSDQTKMAINQLQNTAQNSQNTYLQNLLKQATSSDTHLQDIASGKAVGQNTAFNDALQNTLNRTASTINAQMSGAGRYGSAANNSVLANTLGSVASKAQSDQYNRDIAQMMQANTLIDQARMNQANTANAFLQGQAARWLDALKGGQILDQNAQKKVDASQQQWSENQMQEWRRLGLLGDAMRNASGKYGSKFGQSETTTNPLSGLFGKILRK